jgi:hypothetical protein
MKIAGWFSSTALVVVMLAPCMPGARASLGAGPEGLPPWPPGFATGEPQTAPPPRINSVQIFFMGGPVSELIVGTKARRYALKIIGQGFDPAASISVDGMRARISIASAVELDATLKGGFLMLPGQAALQIVNPDGQSSNTVFLDIVTDPSILSIARITPDFGPVGTQVTVTGVGFTATGNRVKLFSSASPEHSGVTADVASADGKTLVFTIGGLCPPCVFASPPCELPCLVLNPGQYDISVTNAKGTSNSLKFLVSSPSGPIGFWGVQGFSVEVTDTQVIVSGACFEGQIPQTLTTDTMGNFELAGTITLMIGPGLLARPATYQGTISGNMMTFTIMEGSSTLGPYTVTFGDEVHVVHPCA